MKNKKRIIQINKPVYEEVVLKSTEPYFLMFGADWDHYSLYLYDDIKWYVEKFEGMINFGIVDIEIYRELFTEFEITTIPTMLILEDGKEYCRTEGYIGRMVLEKMMYDFFGYLHYTPMYEETIPKRRIF
ncbi:MAG: thioredoxin family protein [Clostridia bacterium]|nr:thioredoxin family protein [Clostridia bacterium]